MSMDYPITVLRERLKFEKDKLKQEKKTWEVEIRLRIENKISELEKAIEILKQNQDAK